MPSDAWGDNIFESSTTTGTGDIALAGAVSGFAAFSSATTPGGVAIANNDRVYYSIWTMDSQGNRISGGWEVGYGTYNTTGPAIARTTVLASSNGNALVNFAAGTKGVALVRPSNLDALPQNTFILGTGATQTGTIAIPPGAREVEIEGVSAGGGGGGGRVGAASTSRFGGNGGNGGNYGRVIYKIADLGGATALYWGVGPQANGGAAVGTAAANGNGGQNGGGVSVQLTDLNGKYLLALIGGVGGFGGTAAAQTPNANSVGGGSQIGGTGSQASTSAPTAAAPGWLAPGGGGSGASLTAGNAVVSTGSPGGANTQIGGGGFGGTNAGLNLTGVAIGGGGGTGGTTAGANGTDGADLGGGGGGGSAQLTGSLGGAGGKGGKAGLRITFR